MKAAFGAVAVLVAMIGTDAQAQGVNLSGRWQCLVNCVGDPGNIAYITQNGWDLNILNDAGQPSRAWVNYPGRLWVETANQGAIYSPDGMTIQFDGGAVWQRAPEVPLPEAAPPPIRRRR